MVGHTHKVDEAGVLIAKAQLLLDAVLQHGAVMVVAGFDRSLPWRVFRETTLVDVTRVFGVYNDRVLVREGSVASGCSCNQLANRQSPSRVAHASSALLFCCCFFLRCSRMLFFLGQGKCLVRYLMRQLSVGRAHRPLELRHGDPKRRRAPTRGKRVVLRRGH